MNDESYFYAITERSYHFCVLETGFGSSAHAWMRANRLHASYSSVIRDYDVLLFESEAKRIMFLSFQAQPIGDFAVEAPV